MPIYQDLFNSSIEKFRQENRYRNFVNISRLKGQFPYAINNENGRKITLWCSNDYLGMGQDELAISAAIDSIQRSGLGSGGTRNISGNSKESVLLEKEIAEIYDRQAALSFVSGYIANDATIQALAKIIPDLVIFSDQKNHASIIAGIRNSRLEKNIFRHNDMAHLQELLQKYPVKAPKLIIFESVYSMDGDFGKIGDIVGLAKQYNALTFCDEVHAVGLYGERAGGLCQELGLDHEIDIIQGTFAKAYGCIGGFIAGQSEIIDAVRLNSSGFIFSTSLPPMICAAVRQNIANLAKNSQKRDKLHQNVALLKAKLQENGIEIVKNDSHIVSIKVGDAKKAEEISQKLLNDNDIYVQHINHPTVDKGDERLRITITPLHSEAMVEELVAALVGCW